MILQTLQALETALSVEVMKQHLFFVPEEQAVTLAMQLAWKPVYALLKNSLPKKSRPTHHDLFNPEIRVAIQRFLKRARKSYEPYIAEAFDKAYAYGDERPQVHKDAYEDKRQEILDQIYDALEERMEDHVFEQMLPTVLRLAETMYDNRDSATLSDLGMISDRIDRTMEADSTWATLSSVHTARAYNFGALSYFDDNGIEKYQIQGVLDTHICEVCLRLAGKVFITAPAVQRMNEFRESVSPMDTLQRLFPFADEKQLMEMVPESKISGPELSDVDNQTPEVVRDSGWDTPPFHPWCRCVAVAFSRSADSRVADVTPEGEEIKVPLTEAQQVAISNAARFGEMTDERVTELADRYGISEELVQELSDYLYNETEISVNRQFSNPKSNSLLNTIEDGDLKNQFQLSAENLPVTTSGAKAPLVGGSRDAWEGNIFDGAYQSSDEYNRLNFYDSFPENLAKERPIYGFRETNNRWDAQQYGYVTLKLKPEVIERTTLTTGNSSAISSYDRSDRVGTPHSNYNMVRSTLDYLAHDYNIPQDVDPRDMEAVVRRAMKDGKAQAAPYYSYTEAQIHGGIRMDRDVAAIEVRLRSYAPDFKWIQELGDKYNIPVKYIVDDDIIST
jgi:hypothetical protein